MVLDQFYPVWCSPPFTPQADGGSVFSTHHRATIPSATYWPAPVLNGSTNTALVSGFDYPTPVSSLAQNTTVERAYGHAGCRCRSRSECIKLQRAAEVRELIQRNPSQGQAPRPVQPRPRYNGTPTHRFGRLPYQAQGFSTPPRYPTPFPGLGSPSWTQPAPQQLQGIPVGGFQSPSDRSYRPQGRQLQQAFQTPEDYSPVDPSSLATILIASQACALGGSTLVSRIQRQQQDGIHEWTKANRSAPRPSPPAPPNIPSYRCIIEAPWQPWLPSPPSAYLPPSVRGRRVHAEKPADQEAEPQEEFKKDPTTFKHGPPWYQCHPLAQKVPREPPPPTCCTAQIGQSLQHDRVTALRGAERASPSPHPGEWETFQEFTPCGFHKTGPIVSALTTPVPCSDKPKKTQRKQSNPKKLPTEEDDATPRSTPTPSPLSYGIDRILAGTGNMKGSTPPKQQEVNKVKQKKKKRKVKKKDLPDLLSATVTPQTTGSRESSSAESASAAVAPTVAPGCIASEAAARAAVYEGVQAETLLRLRPREEPLGSPPDVPPGPPGDEALDYTMVQLSIPEHYWEMDPDDEAPDTPDANFGFRALRTLEAFTESTHQNSPASNMSEDTLEEASSRPSPPPPTTGFSSKPARYPPGYEQRDHRPWRVNRHRQGRPTGQLIPAPMILRGQDSVL